MYGGVGRAQSLPTPTVTYTVMAQHTAGHLWTITVDASGFSNHSGSIILRLDRWGSWLSLGASYVTMRHAQPELRADSTQAGVFVLNPPQNWDGRFELAYDVTVARVGTARQQEFGLLPSWNDYASAGFSANTLFQIETLGPRPRRIIRAVPTEGAVAGTGWCGLSRVVQSCEITGPTDRIDNAPIMFGRPTASRTETVDGVEIEVAQFGPGSDVTGEVMAVARAVVPGYGHTSGRMYPRPIRFYLYEGTPGGTNTRTAIISSYRPGEQPLTPTFRHIIAHELFHGWLGGDFILANEAITWLHEGFTDYLALWHATASGVIDRSWFAERLAAINAEARRTSAFGRVALGDSGVDWRHPANERYAYRAGAVVALAVDVALRRVGEPGLMAMIADLGASTKGRPVTLTDVRQWMTHRNFNQLFNAAIEGRQLPSVDDKLEEIGYAVADAPALLTYFGLDVEDGRVSGVDTAGPAAKAGIQPGDRILGRFPGSRSQLIRVGPMVTTPFRYALETAEPGVEGSFFDVIRGSVELRIPITPDLIPGGILRTYVTVEVEKLDRFFARPGGGR